MKHLFLIKQYFFYYLKASTAHGVHSPFVFDFINSVLKNDKICPEIGKVEELRKELLTNRKALNIEDLGAGSLLHKSLTRTVSELAKHAARNKKYGTLLFKLTRHYQYEHIIELGTSLGIGTCFLAMANPSAIVHTIEGSQEIFEQAKLNFEKMKLGNVIQHLGNFDIVFEQVITTLPKIDMIVIDGNHREEPTLRYFEQSLPYVHNDTVLIFDDIHWSQGMQNAWDKIKSHPKVTLSIDVFQFGIVYFKKEFAQKQHFVLRY